MVGDPQILSLDEPTANIDQRMEGEIFDLLNALNERMTILVVSHGFPRTCTGTTAATLRPDVLSTGPASPAEHSISRNSASLAASMPR